MKKIAFIALLLMVIAGCGKGESKGTSTISDPFIGGTTGILLSFEQDAPPAEVFDGGDYPFDVVVKLKNEGEYKAVKADAVLTVSGILASEFNKVESDFRKNPSEDIEGKSKDSANNVQEGLPVFVEFTDLNHAGALSGNIPYTIRADVCYKYGTTVLSQICVKKNNLDNTEGVCTVNEDKKVFNSGAPVQVTGVKESQRAKDKISFTFTISHKGNGDIFQQGSRCDTSSRSFEDKIWVEVDSGIPGLECSGLRDGTATTGYVSLYGADKPITCTQTVATNSDFAKPVNIKLTYDYKDSIETTVLVKHVVN